MKKFRSINIDLAREMFIYEPDTGFLRRRVGVSRFPAGTIVGCRFDTGHLNVSFDGRITGVHRIAWALHYGVSPDTFTIDHISGDGADNRITNLRAASFKENNRNIRLGSRNKSGFKNVFQVKWNDKKKWRVSIGFNDSEYHIMHFWCFGQALKHAREKRAELHGAFANDGHRPVGAL